MGSERSEFTVSELIKNGVLEKPLDGNHGGTHPKSKDYVSEGIPFVMASDMSGGRVDTSNCKFITKKQADSLRKGFAKTGDVLLSHKATIGRTAIVEETVDDYVMLTPQVTYYRIKDQDRLNNKYLRYYFDSAPFQELFNQWAGGGSTRAYLGITGQLKLPIVLPPLPEQKAIAHILGTLDDKIDLNRRMNATLEGMAQALFKSWFVDFDPVIDNALAAGNPIPDELAPRAEVRKKVSAAERKPLPQTIQKGFSDQFVLTETMGWVPEGWKIEPLGDHLYIKGRIGWKGLKRSEYLKEETGYFIANGSDFSDEQIDWNKGGWIPQDRYDESPEIQLKDNDILITKDGTIGKLAFVHKIEYKTSVASGVFVVRTESEKLTTFFCWMFFKSPYFQEVVKSKIDGSVIPHLYQRDFVEMLTPLPERGILKYFERQIEDIYNQVFRNKEEIAQLSKLRDTLLPKLISGELSIPEAKQPAKEAIS